MLLLRQADLERPAGTVRHRLAQVSARLRLIESESKMSVQKVIVKRTDPMRIAALSDLVPVDANFASVLEQLFISAGDLVDAAGQSRLTPVSWSLSEPASSENAVRVFAGFVTSSDVLGLEIVAMPEVEVASVIHHGPVSSVGHGYEAIAQWAEHHGHEFSSERARKRMVFLEADGEDQRDWIVEVQLELA